MPVPMGDETDDEIDDGEDEPIRRGSADMIPAEMRETTQELRRQLQIEKQVARDAERERDELARELGGMRAEQAARSDRLAALQAEREKDPENPRPTVSDRVAVLRAERARTALRAALDDLEAGVTSMQVGQKRARIGIEERKDVSERDYAALEARVQDLDQTVAELRRQLETEKKANHEALVTCMRGRTKAEEYNKVLVKLVAAYERVTPPEKIAPIAARIWARAPTVPGGAATAPESDEADPGDKRPVPPGQEAQKVKKPKLAAPTPSGMELAETCLDRDAAPEKPTTVSSDERIRAVEDRLAKQARRHEREMEALHVWCEAAEARACELEEQLKDRADRSRGDDTE